MVRSFTGPYQRWWTSAASRERAIGALVALVVAAVTGAFLFGLWHVVGGWLIRGNPRAGLFGVALAATTGALLAIGHLTVGKRFRR